MLFLKIAFLNIVKHPKRSLLVVAVVMISVIAMVTVGGMLAGAKNRFTETLLQESGHVQIHAASYKNRLDPVSLASTIENPDPVTVYLEAQAGVVTAEKIIHFGTKIVYKGRSCIIMGEGVRTPTTFYKQVQNGITRGAFLPGGEGIALSERIARLLGCTTGEWVSLIVESSDGSPYYLDYRVTGLFATDSADFDDNYIFISHAEAQELLYLPDQTIEIRANLQNPDAAGSLETATAQYLGERHLSLETWREIFGSFVVLMEFFDFFMIFLNLIVLIVAATVITNTVLMSAFERVRDLGTLRAIGLKKRHIFLLIVSEGAVQGVIGGVFGLVIAVPLLLYLQGTGWSMGEVAEAMKLGSTFPFAFSWFNTLAAFVFGALVAVAGSCYAGLVNVRMKVVDALKFV